MQNCATVTVVSPIGLKLTNSFSNVCLYFFLRTNLSLWNFRVCTISGLFCRKFHKCILSSEQTETRAPYNTQEIKSSIIPKLLNQQAYPSNKMSSLFIIITFFFLILGMIPKWKLEHTVSFLTWRFYNKES